MNIKIKDIPVPVYLAVSLILALCGIFIGRGVFAHQITILFVSFWIGLPLLIISLLSLGKSLVRKSGFQVNKPVLGMTIIILFQFLSLGPAKSLNRYDINQAMKFCESLIPSLEKIKAETGRYPDDIHSIPTKLKPPFLLSRQTYPFYKKCDQDTYSFDFDSGEMMLGWNYDSKSKKWNQFD